MDFSRFQDRLKTIDEISYPIIRKKNGNDKKIYFFCLTPKQINLVTETRFSICMFEVNFSGTKLPNNFFYRRTQICVRKEIISKIRYY